MAESVRSPSSGAEGALPLGWTTAEILARVPHAPPFRFVDEVLEVSAERARGSYRFRIDEAFYAGHFPKSPVTPGVILIETMCQTAMLPLGLYLLSLEPAMHAEARARAVLTDVEAEFYRPVLPGETVIGEATKVFWRGRKLRAALELRSSAGELLAAGHAGAIGVLET
ncbi:MAG: beta-hydroxyacyl-ACP dehydratase [Planctomycetes bacterium]|nr:beta-hydroxyacyl-ACP dehydratase [Planctomycetota bacterium]